jgi:hypothetical protein
MEWIGWLLSLIVPCLVTAGTVLLLFLWANGLGRVIRQVIAAIAGPLLIVGPGLASNMLAGEEDFSFYLIYSGLYLVASVPTAILLTRLLDRRFESTVGVFK